MVVLKHEWTRDTELCGDVDSTSCVMSTGEIIICDRKYGEEWKLYFYNPDMTSTGHMAQYPCEHRTHLNVNPYKLLPITIEGKEYIAVSCNECHMIHLINPEDLNQELVVAYEGNAGDMGPMCLGPALTLYVVGKYSGHVSLLDCTSTRFNLKAKLFQINNLFPDVICYIEDDDLIVLSSLFHRRICAVRSSDGHIVWEISEQIVNGKEWRPQGLTFLHDPDLLLVGDWGKERIIILSPITGDIMYIVPLLKKDLTHWINNIHVINDKLLVNFGEKLSHYLVRFYTLHDTK